jgi:hypothetical protein
MSIALRCAVVTLLVASLMPLRAQSPEGNWDNLQRIKPDQEVEIVTNDAKAYRGTLRSLQVESIIVRLVSGDHAFERANILRVAYKPKGRRSHHVKVGTAIGAGFGVVNAFFSDGCQSGGCRFAGVGISALLGAAIGAALPAGGWEVLYRSPLEPHT